MPMKITSITISEKAGYLKTREGGDYIAKVAVNGEAPYNAGITVDLDAEQLAPIVSIIEQIVAKNMAAAAAQFSADVLASLSPPVEHTELPPPWPSPAVDDDLPAF